MDELLAEFVAETREMLEASEGEIVAWEADPADRARLDTIFRFVHTVKGNCGFFDFPHLAALSHAAEDALAEVRAGRREPDSALVTSVLAIIDRIAQMVDAIEAGEDFAQSGDEALIAALRPADARSAAVQPPIGDSHASPTPPRKSDTAIAAPRSIRLPVELLDRVMSGVSDMVLARNDLAHRLRQAGTQPTIDGPFERLTAILSDVRDAVTRMRMQRIETLFAPLPRLVRDLSAELGKQVTLDLEGGDVELDREMIEMVRDPLTHIIRNAIDHGIESPADRAAAGKPEAALLSIAARQSGNTISIVVGDDGRGLDERRIAAKGLATELISESERDQMSRERLLQLIFQPGFSTAESVSTVSGRGVGLDVVQQNLERVGGSIKVSSTSGVGTLFTLQIPLTLSIITGLTVEVGEQRFAIPQSYVEEIVHSTANALDLAQLGDAALVTFRGERIPCLMLSDVLGLPSRAFANGDHTMVLLRLASGDLFALAIDGIHHHGDLVVKPLAPAIMKTGIYAGSTLLDDGRPILLLDVTSIANRYGLVSDARTRVLADAGESEQDAPRETVRAMLFTGFDGRRSAVRLGLVQRIETVDAVAIETSAGSACAVIDGVILPLVGLPEGPVPADRVRLLRLGDGASELLLAVRDIEDAVALDHPLKPVRDDPLVEAVTLQEGRTVALLDAHELFARHGEAPQATARPLCRVPDDEWSRAILAPLVESAGYEVSSEPGDSADVTIVFADEPHTGEARDQSGAVIRLRSRADAPNPDQTIYRYDRDGLIAALRQAATGGPA
ncbi:chemotaxis protein CheA [Erythrobacter sp. JK5]|uniref:chemotaxis protein CheA n=1 Tax=Erythrobacter sp. JK5 TaxID=2829500 RepID=UPI001BA88896|nr:chemotaxis protein CheA [Erythrobacter sp. JK5]QUL36716.1 chemotaxis protein CheA [Erythrobacter sp. JK5]